MNKQGIILLLDTVHPVCTITLLYNDGNFTEYLNPVDTRNNFDTVLNDKVLELLKDSSLSFSDIDAYAVVTGAGSWTGARVGVATVKGWGMVHPKPVIELNSLDVDTKAKEGIDVALHSGGKKYFVRRMSEYSYETLESTQDFLIIDNTNPSYRQGLIQSTRQKFKDKDFIKPEDLKPFYVTEFRPS